MPEKPGSRSCNMPSEAKAGWLVKNLTWTMLLEVIEGRLRLIIKGPSSNPEAGNFGEDLRFKKSLLAEATSRDAIGLNPSPCSPEPEPHGSVLPFGPT